MAENKKSFIMYCDWIELFEDLPDEKAGELIKHIFRYTNDQHPKTDDLVLKTSFSLIKQQLKRDLVKYENRREKNKKTKQSLRQRRVDRQIFAARSILSNALF